IPARQRNGDLGRAARAVAPQHQRAGHGVSGVQGTLNAPLVPAKAGTQHLVQNWMPAFAGMSGCERHRAPRSFARNSAHAPRNGANAKRTAYLPGGTCTARKMTLARKISVSTPSMVARHHGCHTSLSTTRPPDGVSASMTTSVLA